MTVKISALPAAGALAGTEVLEGVQSGASKKITAQAIADLGAAGSGITWAVIEKTTDFTVLTTQTGSAFVSNSASQVIFTLPSVTAGDINKTYRFIKGNTGPCVIFPNDSDIIRNFSATNTLTNTTAETGVGVTLQLISETVWAVLAIEGTWAESGIITAVADGYRAGGFSGARVNTIDKFPFATTTDAASHGTLLDSVTANHGANDGTVQGFIMGGNTSGGKINRIQVFPFASATGAIDHADLTDFKDNGAGHQSGTDGFWSGGANAGGGLTNIDKYPFATTTNASAHGALTVVHQVNPANSSSVGDGFTAGGSLLSGLTRVIDKFPFSTGSGGIDHGNLSTPAVNQLTGVSSSDSGFACGGNFGASRSDIIDKYPFATTTCPADQCWARS